MTSGVAWQEFAACRGMDPEIFYPERGESMERAREVCEVCAVAGPCADAGLAETLGVWGGLSARERRRMRSSLRRRRFQPAGEVEVEAPRGIAGIGPTARERVLAELAVRGGSYQGRMIHLAAQLGPGPGSAVRAALQQLRLEGLVDVRTSPMSLVSLTEAGWAAAAVEASDVDRVAR